MKDFFTEVIRASLYKIGQLWEEGKISVAEEHISSAIAYGGHKTRNKRGKKVRVIITSAPNEFHDLGGRIVADFLEYEGFNVYYLGANTPLNDVLSLARKIRPKILGISVAMPFKLYTR